MSLRSLLCVAACAVLVLCTCCIPVLAYSSAAVQLYEQGNSSVAAGNNTAALEALAQATALEPAYYEAWDAQADALNREGQYSNALAASDKALAINPNYLQGWINRGLILYNIGYVYEDQHQDITKANEYYTQQLLAFEKAIALDPTNADAWFNKGYALAGMKRYDEALAAFDKVKELNPAYPKIEQNYKIAEQLRDQVTPAYVKFAPVIVGVAALLAGLAIWYVFLRERKED